jgi:hypothetical protein
MLEYVYLRTLKALTSLEINRLDSNFESNMFIFTEIYLFSLAVYLEKR